MKFLVNKNFTKNNKNIIFFNNHWVNGLVKNKKVDSFFHQKDIQLILIIKSSIDEKHLNKELSTLQIPIISFIDTNQSLENINYPILTNSKNIKSLYTLMFLIRKLF
jgi:ribosomal protein S2